MLMGALLAKFVLLINYAVSIYVWIVIISAIMSWVSPGSRNPLAVFIRNITEPVFNLVRRLIPVTLGSMDFSPLIVILGLQFIVRPVLLRIALYIAGILMG